MAYKDKDQQKQANKEANRRYREKRKGITEQEGIAQGITALTKDQLYQVINSYPQDSWVNSPEHKELTSRLHSMTIEQLETEGYWIPVWKHVEAA